MAKTIGLTFDLRSDYLALGYSKEETAEFDKPETVEAIETALCSLGFHTVRIGHAQHLVSRLAAGERWDLVFNIAEGLYGLGREALVPALLDAYKIPYTFSDPLVLALTLHKGMTKHVVRDLGYPTADFFVLESEDGIDRIDLPFPLFAKPVAEGTSKGISAQSVINSPAELKETAVALLHAFNQPVLLETFLPGREFTVGVLGTGTAARAIGVLEVRLRAGAESNSYSYQNKQNYEKFIEYVLCTDEPHVFRCGELAAGIWRGLGCRDAGRVDFRMDNKGELCFLEVNPLAGLNPVDSDLPILWRKLGNKFEQLIAAIVQSALARTEHSNS